jgi:hypothetical protein
VLAYSSTTDLTALLIFLGWIVFIGVAIWAVIRISRNRSLGRGAKALLFVSLVLFPPLGLGVCLVSIYVTEYRRRPAADSGSA